MSSAARRAAAVFAALALATPLGPAQAETKDECIEAHGLGQDLREAGQLRRAHELFMTCAQATCPALLSADCARFGDEVLRLVPTVSFGARDDRGVDLPDTSVFVDDRLVATRLDDGRSFELDPGRHVVRFVHDGREFQLSPVLNQGEKGRALVATFAAAPLPRAAGSAPSPPASRSRQTGPLWLSGLGAAGLVTGAVLVVAGLHRIPDGCSLSTHDCAAPPGDPALDAARQGVALTNAGVGVGIAGAAVAAFGLGWYLSEPAPRADGATGATTFVAVGSSGVQVGGRF